MSRRLSVPAGIGPAGGILFFPSGPTDLSATASSSARRYDLTMASTASNSVMEFVVELCQNTFAARTRLAGDDLRSLHALMRNDLRLNLSNRVTVATRSELRHVHD